MFFVSLTWILQSLSKMYKQTANKFNQPNQNRNAEKTFCELIDLQNMTREWVNEIFFHPLKSSWKRWCIFTRFFMQIMPVVSPLAMIPLISNMLLLATAVFRLYLLVVRVLCIFLGRFFIVQSMKRTFFFFFTVSITITLTWRSMFLEWRHWWPWQISSCTATLERWLQKVFQTCLIVSTKSIGINSQSNCKSTWFSWSRMRSDRFSFVDLAWSPWIWKPFARYDFSLIFLINFPINSLKWKAIIVFFYEFLSFQLIRYSYSYFMIFVTITTK